jgi:hypothetical protein
MGIHKNGIITIRVIIAIIKQRKIFSKLCTDYAYFCEDLTFFMCLIASAADPSGPAV